MEYHQSILDRCSVLVASGNHSEAQILLDQATLDHPEDGRLWQAVGLFRHRTGHFPEARHALETAGLLVPLDSATRCALAECFGRTGHDNLAGEIYRDLASEPDCPDELLPNIAAGLGYLGMFGAALGTCLELVRRSPRLAEAHFGVAFYLRRLGRSPETILPVVAKAHELAPQVPLYRISLATLLDHVGRREEACELIRDLDLDSVSCRGCLRRMTTIFLAAGKSGQAGSCRLESEGNVSPDVQ